MLVVSILSLFILKAFASNLENSIELEAILPPDVNLYENDIKVRDESSDDTLEGDPLSPDDFTKGANLTEDDIVAPENNTILQAPHYFEGDILLGNLRIGRNAIRDSRSKWPGGRIPYAISSVFGQRDRSVIARAFQEFHEETCLRFTPRQQERDFIYLTSGDGCHSPIGRNGGRQSISLGTGCVYVGVVIHELLHSTGFWHEQSRADRDDFVTILWDNINPKMRYNFAKFTLREMQHLGEKYDYGSVMHYQRNAFSIDPSQPTILPKKPGFKLGQRRGFSSCDIRKVNKLYKCDSGPPEIIKPEESKKCQDHEKKCSKWSKEDECEKNSKWMLQYCQKSCNVCGNKKGDCRDHSGYCSYWADKGECKKNPRYMLPMCPLSCNQCKISPASGIPCQDKKKKCPQWASKGFCKTQRNYMATYCQRSCRICG